MADSDNSNIPAEGSSELEKAQKTDGASSMRPRSTSHSLSSASLVSSNSARKARQSMADTNEAYAARSSVSMPPVRNRANSTTLRRLSKVLDGENTIAQIDESAIAEPDAPGAENSKESPRASVSSGKIEWQTLVDSFEY
jgi:hypothetical protein